MLPAESVEIHSISSSEIELKWEILEKFQLGGGGFADVFHVFYNGQDAVLKKSRAKFTNEERENIHREAFIVASLHNCPNVIRLFGICEDSPFCGMIMEYCAGPNLLDLVRRLDQLNVEMESLRVFKWCHELARTLCHLNLTHYHGDLTLKNVFVKERPCCCRNGVKYDNVRVRDTTYKLCLTCKGVHLEHISLKIGDFGMSCEHGKPRKYVGTLKYLAPETEKGIYTEKSEVYSFGILMLTLVLGKPTDECADEQATFMKTRRHKNFDLSKCTSNSFSETIAQCTHQLEEDRPSFKQLLEKLNGKYEHYLRLKGNDRRTEANRERDEFLVDYKIIPKRLTKNDRTVTTSTFLSSTSTLNSIDFIDPKYYGGPLDNDVFIESPLTTPSTSRKNSGYETPRSYVENRIYTEDEPIVQLPIKRKREERRLWKVLRQARSTIAQKMRNIISMTR